MSEHLVSIMVAALAVVFSLVAISVGLALLIGLWVMILRMIGVGA